jgi:hypothetical protein
MAINSLIDWSFIGNGQGWLAGWQWIAGLGLPDIVEGGLFISWGKSVIWLNHRHSGRDEGGHHEDRFQRFPRARGQGR